MEKFVKKTSILAFLILILGAYSLNAMGNFFPKNASGHIAIQTHHRFIDSKEPTDEQKVLYSQHNQEKQYISEINYEDQIYKAILAFIKAGNQQHQLVNIAVPGWSLDYESLYLQGELQWAKWGSCNEARKEISSILVESEWSSIFDLKGRKWNAVDDLVARIIEQFKPYCIRGLDSSLIDKEPWYNSSCINWYGFAMEARGKINKFLSFRSGLELVNLRLFKGVTSVGSYFIPNNTALTSLNLQPLSKLTSVGDKFLFGCRCILEIDLSFLNKLIYLGHSFLEGCESLIRINFPPSSNITSVGNGFLEDCKSLTTVNILFLNNATSVGDNFLVNCHNLTHLSLEPLSKVMFVWNFFLSNLYRLTALDLSPLSNVTSVGQYFLINCTSLTSIDLSPLSKLTYLPDGFLRGCKGLTSIDFLSLSNVTSVGNGFLNGCSDKVRKQCELFLKDVEKRK